MSPIPRVAPLVRARLRRWVRAHLKRMVADTPPGMDPFHAALLGPYARRSNSGYEAEQ